MYAIPKTHATNRRTPKFTIVVLCDNYGHFLAQCVESTVAQPKVETQVVTIDDETTSPLSRSCRLSSSLPAGWRPGGSNDDSQLRGQELAFKYKNVDFLAHDRNIGHIRTYNEGPSQAGSDYVVLLSADDLLTPRSLTRAAQLLDSYPTLGLVYGGPLTFVDELRSMRVIHGGSGN